MSELDHILTPSLTPHSTGCTQLRPSRQGVRVRASLLRVYPDQALSSFTLGPVKAMDGVLPPSRLGSDIWRVCVLDSRVRLRLGAWGYGLAVGVGLGTWLGSGLEVEEGDGEGTWLGPGERVVVGARGGGCDWGPFLEPGRKGSTCHLLSPM